MFGQETPFLFIERGGFAGIANLLVMDLLQTGVPRQARTASVLLAQFLELKPVFILGRGQVRGPEFGLDRGCFTLGYRCFALGFRLAIGNP